MDCVKRCLVIATALALISSAALAQQRNCKSIQDPKERLACFNTAVAPKPAAKKAAPKAVDEFGKAKAAWLRKLTDPDSAKSGEFNAVPGDNLPSIDLEKACGVRAKTSAEMMGDKSSAAGRPFDWCMKSEQKARDALAAAWKDIPENFKAFCIAPNVYSPSYTEWISCVELRIDLKKAGQKQ